MKALREAGNSVVSEFSGLGEAELTRRPADDELSLKEIAAHLRDAEELAFFQVTSLVESPAKPVPVWDVDVLPLERDYRSADLREVLAEFRAMRRDTTYLLWGATEGDWRRPCKHPYKGTVTLEEIARGLAQHDLEHLWQVRRLKHEMGMDRVRVSDDWDDWRPWGGTSEDSLP
jgi:hypothetical protein